MSTLERGVYYIATDDWLVKEAKRSANRVRSLYDLPLAIATDSDLELDVFDEVVRVKEPTRDFQDKVELFSETPFEETIYLDTDTYVCDDSVLSELFSMLERYDIAATMDSARRLDIHHPTGDRPSVSSPGPMAEPNTGVVVYHRDRCSELFKNWSDLHQEFKQIREDIGDQAAFHEAIYNTDIEFSYFSPEFNFRLPVGHYVRYPVRILHGRAFDYQRIQKSINSNLSPNGVTYYPIIVDPVGGKRRQIIPAVDPSPGEIYLKGIRSSIQEFGLARTLCAILLGGPQTGNYRFHRLNQAIDEDGLMQTLKRTIQWATSNEW